MEQLPFPSRFVSSSMSCTKTPGCEIYFTTMSLLAGHAPSIAHPRASSTSFSLAQSAVFCYKACLDGDRHLQILSSSLSLDSGCLHNTRASASSSLEVPKPDLQCSRVSTRPPSPPPPPHPRQMLSTFHVLRCVNPSPFVSWYSNFVAVM